MHAAELPAVKDDVFIDFKRRLMSFNRKATIT